MNNEEKKENLTLQSEMFGHRFKPSQTVYEYLLEFLIVAFSEKMETSSKELFPIENETGFNMKFKPNNYIGLKRFVFFNKSKEDGKTNLDKYAYEKHLEALKEKIYISDNYESLNKDYAIDVIQNLLYSFSAITENRSWFAQSLLPICEYALTTELMMQSDKKKYGTSSEELKYMDSKFDTSRYSFMARGGEVYYLHIFNALKNNPEYKEAIEDGFKALIGQFKELEKLCETIQVIWSNKKDEFEDLDKKIPKDRGIKSLGKIPNGFKEREKNSLEELENILNSDMHPFEKLNLLSLGVIIQIIIMTYDQAREVCGKKKGYLIFDINCYKGRSNEEVKKIAAMNYNNYTQDILDALYEGVKIYKNKNKNGDEKSEDDTIKDAIKDSLNVYKKLGKSIGIIRPLNDKSIRFTLDEKTLKFIVLSLVKPDTKMTFDRFVDKLYEHFRIVVGKNKLLEIDKNYNDTNASFLDSNRNDLQIMLKECGFLRELSDSTSIVENPYSEVCYEKIY